MGDILCRICGEPWDAGARHGGDMTAGEYRMLIRGEGCPACKGKRPEGRAINDIEFIESLDANTDGDEALDAAMKLEFEEKQRRSLAVKG
uniref:Uncharacterized protein n=1 Tax=viral metagenome TaxID=1070528 RepID=A0A6M3X615_9ZZZZ